MKLTLVKKQQEAGDAWSFFWEPEAKFEWKPGQFLYYNLVLPETDPRGNTRHFTIASSPTENIIQLTTKISDSVYKQKLVKLEPGDSLEAIGPRGDFVLDSEQKNLQVFLAGGIGITPFRSFIRYTFNRQFSTPMHLFYSNSTTDEIVFKEELDDLVHLGGVTDTPPGEKKSNLNLRVSYTITHPEASQNPRHGLTGRISAEMIKVQLETAKWSSRDMEDPKMATFWVCDPPAFVSGMQDELKKLGIPADNVEIEQFSGY